MFAISTISVVLRAMFVLLGLKMITMDGSDSRDALDGFNTRMRKLLDVELALCFLGILVGDSLVIWRTWVLWSKKLNVLIIPILLHLGTVILAFALWTCEGLHPSLADLSTNVAPPCIPLEISMANSSVATNIAATVAIGYKVAPKSYNEIPHEKQPDTENSKARLAICRLILFHLGTILGMAVTISSGVANASLPLQFINFWIQGSARHVMGIYPTSLFVVAHLQKSFWVGPDQAPVQNSPGAGDASPAIDRRSPSE
ncbi:hypothetical protein VNI00_010175 [Paramarasmius palmivorus]|uniref:Uncharacterized protein n=1 Tax=Paramarasmius palmivorus TaxID=297713 RepID=A0AAW0CJT8_9AGAR